MNPAVTIPELTTNLPAGTPLDELAAMLAHEDGQTWALLTHTDRDRYLRLVEIVCGHVEDIAYANADREAARLRNAREQLHHELRRHVTRLTTDLQLLRGLADQAAIDDKRAAAPTHCKNGHQFTDGNVWWNKKGNPVCRTCRRDATRRYRAKQKAAAA